MSRRNKALKGSMLANISNSIVTEKSGCVITHKMLLDANKKTAE